MTPPHRHDDKQHEDHRDERAQPVELGPSTEVRIQLSTLFIVIAASLSIGAWALRVEGKLSAIQRALEVEDRWTGTHMQTWVDGQADANPGHVYLDPSDVREGRHPKRIKPSVAAIGTRVDGGR